MRKVSFLFICLFVEIANAQAPIVSAEVDSNYNNWGWKTIVLRNDLITFATVPAIGARVMQYDLGNLQSLYVNPSILGKTYTPAQNGNWYNFGGFKTWPAPQSRWPGTWPPPPTLDYGNYSFQIDSLSPDHAQAAVSAASPTEKWIAPNIRFERTATVFSGTTRIRMDQTIMNVGSVDTNWGVWGISQSIVNHPGKKDYQNYWVYFPINPKSVYGPGGVSPQGASAAWKGEIAPGIYGVQFSPDNQKIYADPDRGWIAYSSASDTLVFAKTFDIFEGEHYPDSARISVYVSGSVAPVYVEVEVKGPIVQLAATGGSYTFTENWWAARVRGPVLNVDSVGAVARKLTLDASTKQLSGIYGVFYHGTAKIVYVDGTGAILGEGIPQSISPLQEFQYQDSAAVPSGSIAAQLRVYNGNGFFVGVLDSVDASQLVSSVAPSTATKPKDFYLSPNYPNPFNGGTVLTVSVSASAHGSLKIYDVLGRLVATLVEGNLTAGVHHFAWNPARAASGIYIARLEGPGIHQVQKLVYLR